MHKATRSICKIQLVKGIALSAMVLIASFVKAQITDPFKGIAEMEGKLAERNQQLELQGESFSKASSNFDIHYLVCQWVVDPSVRYIKGAVKAGFTITQRTNIITFDLADELKIDSIHFRSQKINHYRPFDNSVIVNLGIFLDPNTKDAVEIFYKGVPPSLNRNGSFQTSTHNGTPVMWTASQPFGGRDWWPCKNGLDDKVDSIDVFITTPETFTSSSNGRFIEEEISAELRTTHWKHRYPIAPYLIAFAATNYRVITDQVQLGSTLMPMMDHVYPEHHDEFLHAAPITKRTLQLLHNLFAPYPFIQERYGHTQYSGSGGTEHQTNSFMENMNETLIVHEAAHQWFGNMVTCGSWRDIWLNEGFAVFCTNLSAEINYPKNHVLNLYRNQINYIASQGNGSVYVNDTSIFSRIFDPRLTYNKGGWVLQMLRWKLGDSVFFRATRNYLHDKAYGFARSADLIAHFEKESGQDLTEFFSDWLYGQGFPSYSLKWATAGTTWVQTTLSQATSDPSVGFFEMPVPILFKNKYSDTTIVINHVINGQVNFSQLGFIPDSAIIDPEFKLLSANNDATRIEIFSNDDNISVFPNPIGNEFSLLLKNMTEGILYIKIYNTKGDLLYSRRVGSFRGNELIVIPSERIPRGMYWIRIQKDDEPAIVRKIVK